MEREPILAMEQIDKSFPGAVALDTVDFQVYPKEIVALVGENGAGKSTLIRILTGVYHKDRGRISEESIGFMQDGWIDSVVDHRQYNFGYYAVMMLSSMNIFGEDMTMYMLGFDPTVDTAGNIMYTPSFLITTDNLPEFQEWHAATFE